MRRKVLILANSDIGLYKFRKDFIEELQKDYEVIISLPKGEFIRNFESMGVKFIDTYVDRRGLNPLKDAKLFLKYYLIMKKENPDLVITYTIKPNVYGGIVSGLLNINYAINITGLGSAFQSNKYIKKLVIYLYKIALKKVKVVFFENEENRRIFIDCGIVGNEKTHVLMGAGVNLDYYYPTEYPKGDITRFLFIGRVMKEKGIEELFDAVRSLFNDGYKIHLDIVGGLEEQYFDIIKIYQQQGWLTYHGFQKDIRPFIAQSHCFVLPSWHEGMANSNLECAASARPIITTNIYGCKEAVDNGVSGILVERKDFKSLRSALIKFYYMDYEKRKELGINGRKRMEMLFDKKNVVMETITRLR